MKILLATLNSKYIHSNLAIRILYEMNHEIPGLEWKEFTIKEDKNNIAGFCSQFDVIAFSCYIWNISHTLEVAKRIKEQNKNAKILLGGPEVSYDFDSVISKKEVDYIIYGEGEIAFQKFLQQYGNWENIPSLAWKKDNQIIKNKVAEPFNILLFSESMPYRFDEISSLQNKVLYIETSRGCPYKCEFCLASLDNKVRYLPMESIKKTLLFMMENGRIIKFLDRTFNLKKDFTLEIFQFILDHYKPGNVFQFEITADILHPDIICFVNEKVPKNLFRFEIGIQSVKQEANKAVSRNQNFEKTKEIISLVKNKVELHLDLIVGLPHDYYSDIKKGIEDVFKLYAPEFQLGFLKFLKGTPLREKFRQYEYVFDENPPYQIIRSSFLSESELEKIVRAEDALEIYWNSGKAVYTLKYLAEKYSVYDFLESTGIYFFQNFAGKQYGIKEMYDTLIYSAKKSFPEDKIVTEMISIDFHLHHKVKPKSILSDEIDKQTKNRLINELNLNHHKYRFAFLPITFKWKSFINENKIDKENEWLIIQYDGINKPQILNSL